MKCFSMRKIRATVTFFFVCVGLACLYVAASAYAAPTETIPQEKTTLGDGLNQEESLSGVDSDEKKGDGPAGGISPKSGTCGDCTWEYKEEKYKEEGPGPQERERFVLYIRPTNGESGTLDTWENTEKMTPPWITDEGVSRRSWGDSWWDRWVRNTPRARTERVVIEGKIKAKTCQRMFERFPSLKSIENFANLDTEGVTNMACMFYDCRSLQELNVGGLNTSSVIDMYGMFWGCDQLTSLPGIEKWNTGAVENMGFLFSECFKLTLPGIENWDTHAVENMGSLFNECHALTSLNLQKWCTTKVKRMDQMFKDCYRLTSIGDVSEWNTGAVESMSRMFESYGRFDSSLAQELVQELAGYLAGWNVEAVTDMSGMFAYSGFTSLDLSRWNVKAAENVSEMFSKCYSLKELKVDTWDVKKVKNMARMFDCCYGLTSLDLRKWDTTAAQGDAPHGSELICRVEMTGMFAATLNLQTIYLGHKFLFTDDTSSFSDASDHRESGVDNGQKEAKIGKYWMHVEGGTDKEPTGKFFPSANAFVIFHNALVKNKAKGEKENQGNGFEKYIRADTQGKVELEDIKEFYGGCEWGYALKDRENGKKTYTLYIRPQEGKDNAGLLGDWSSSVGDSSKGDNNPPWARGLYSEYRRQTTHLVIAKGRTGTLVKIITGKGMFEDFEKLSEVDLSGLDTKDAKDMTRMFAKCPSLTSLDLKDWDVSSVTSMESMFENCYHLGVITFAPDDGSKHWKTSSLCNVKSMFSGCGSLAQVDGLQYWDTSKVTEMSSVFTRCYSLPSLNLSHWTTSAATVTDDMFSGAWSVNALCLGHGFELKHRAGLFDMGERFDNQWMQVNLGKGGTLANPKGGVFASLGALMEFHNNQKGRNPEWYVRRSIHGVYGQCVWEYAPSGEKDSNGVETYVFRVRPLIGEPEAVRQNIPYWKRDQLPPWMNPDYDKYYSSTTKIVFEGDVKIDNVVLGGTGATKGDEHVKSVFAEGSFNSFENLDMIDVAGLNIEDGDGVADIGNMLAGSSKVTCIRVNTDFQFGEASQTTAESLRFVDKDGNPTGVKWAHVDPEKGGTREDPKGETFETFDKLCEFQSNIKDQIKKRSTRRKRSAQRPGKKPVEYVKVLPTTGEDPAKVAGPGGSTTVTLTINVDGVFKENKVVNQNSEYELPSMEIPADKRLVGIKVGEDTTLKNVRDKVFITKATTIDYQSVATVTLTINVDGVFKENKVVDQNSEYELPSMEIPADKRLVGIKVGEDTTLKNVRDKVFITKATTIDYQSVATVTLTINVDGVFKENKVVDQNSEYELPSMEIPADKRLVGIKVGEDTTLKNVRDKVFITKATTIDYQSVATVTLTINVDGVFKENKVVDQNSEYELPSMEIPADKRLVGIKVGEDTTLKNVRDKVFITKATTIDYQSVATVTLTINVDGVFKENKVVDQNSEYELPSMKIPADKRLVGIKVGEDTTLKNVRDKVFITKATTIDYQSVATVTLTINVDGVFKENKVVDQNSEYELPSMEIPADKRLVGIKVGEDTTLKNVRDKVFITKATTIDYQSVATVTLTINVDGVFKENKVVDQNSEYELPSMEIPADKRLVGIKVGDDAALKNVRDKVFITKATTIDYQSVATVTLTINVDGVFKENKVVDQNSEYELPSMEIPADKRLVGIKVGDDAALKNVRDKVFITKATTIDYQSVATVTLTINVDGVFKENKVVDQNSEYELLLMEIPAGKRLVGIKVGDDAALKNVRDKVFITKAVTITYVCETEVTLPATPSVSKQITPSESETSIRSGDSSASTRSSSSDVSKPKREASSAPSRDIKTPAQQAPGWRPSTEGGAQKWYFYGKDGKKLLGQHQLVGGKNGQLNWFYFDEKTGEQVRGWKHFDHQKKWCYYSTEDGAMLKGQHELKGGNDGGKHWFYFDEVTGAQIRGWKPIAYQNKLCYYSEADGRMLKGQHELEGGIGGGKHWFYFDEETGAQIRGWKPIAYQNKWCYYSDADGTMLKGQHELEGGDAGGKHWFYFDEETGAELRNCWKEIPSQSKTCYYGPDGAMCKGLCRINGREHYFNKETGALVW